MSPKTYHDFPVLRLRAVAKRRIRLHSAVQRHIDVGTPPDLGTKRAADVLRVPSHHITALT